MHHLPHPDLWAQPEVGKAGAPSLGPPAAQPLAAPWVPVLAPTWASRAKLGDRWQSLGHVQQAVTPEVLLVSPPCPLAFLLGLGPIFGCAERRRGVEPRLIRPGPRERLRPLARGLLGQIGWNTKLLRAIAMPRSYCRC